MEIARYFYCKRVFNKELVYSVNSNVKRTMSVKLGQVKRNPTEYRSLLFFFLYRVCLPDKMRDKISYTIFVMIINLNGYRYS